MSHLLITYFHEHPEIQDKFAFQVASELYLEEIKVAEFENQLKVSSDSEMKLYYSDFMLALWTNWVKASEIYD